MQHSSRQTKSIRKWYQGLGIILRAYMKGRKRCVPSPIRKMPIHRRSISIRHQLGRVKGCHHLMGVCHQLREAYISENLCSLHVGIQLTGCTRGVENQPRVRLCFIPTLCERKRVRLVSEQQFSQLRHAEGSCLFSGSGNDPFGCICGRLCMQKNLA